MLKKLWLIVLFSSLLIQFHGQAERNATPYTWNISNNLAGAVSFLTIPQLNIGRLTKSDLVEHSEKRIPYRFASSIPINIGLQNSGIWTTLPHGNRLWMAGLECKDALGLSFVFDDFNLPKGAKLFIYNDERTDLLGAFTDKDNNPNRTLSIPEVKGSRIWIEYFEPLASRGEGRIHLRSVGRVYRRTNSEERMNDDDLNCHVNSICNEMRLWHDSKNSVVRISMDGVSRWCSGVLVNSVGHKTIPYVLTTKDALRDNPSQWIFHFDFESTTCNGFDGDDSQFVSGGKLLAVDDATGIVLIQLNKNPGARWNTYYSGWDWSGKIPMQIACIHHPNGDIKKVASSTSDQIFPRIWEEHETWSVSQWNIGATEHGSVGAPIFNEKGLLVGLLAGGYSTCSQNKEDYVVKLSDAWETLGNFLDPQQVGTSSLAGQLPIDRPIDERIIERKVAFYPNPAEDILKLYNDSNEDVLYVNFYDMEGRFVVRRLLSQGTLRVDDLPVGMYIIEIQLETMSIKDNLIIQR